MTVAALVATAEAQETTLGRLALKSQAEFAGMDEEAVLKEMVSRLQVMKAAIERGLQGDQRSMSEMVGGDAARVMARAPKAVTGSRIQTAVARALAVSEVNACMGCIVAAPTAGASGVLPAVVVTAGEAAGAGDREMALALLAAGAVGAVVARNASVSGAEGGCQAEVGSAAAMAAAAAVELAGGTPRQAADAAAIVLKSALGLVCDPVAGLVEVPCVKRNGMYAASALVAADMAMAGVQSVIPIDEVIETMGQIGRTLPETLRETAQGGLAATPTGQRVACKMQGSGDRWGLD
ncbi:MAG TPA: L-serine ammonia-lyase, iron-sulfur-dependent, subunit alpha [Symbiobacteriaceae bacterium]|nr:L-serine ammonia-lyase, iron-sulfur-dependent, subunit alpha [Symbiobacteriaceae bacterium]